VRYLDDLRRVARPAIDAETGRGLEIVALLSDRWGYYRPDSGGKIVWATIDLNSPREAV
jgi:hypothetical protein